MDIIVAFSLFPQGATYKKGEKILEGWKIV